MKKGKTSQDLATPLFIGALLSGLGCLATIMGNVSAGNVPMYSWTSVISTIFLVLVYLILGIMIKTNRICGDWDVLSSFLLACAAILAVTGVLAVISGDPHDVIPVTTVTTGVVDIVAACVLLYFHFVMVRGKVNLISRAVFYGIVIVEIAVVIVALYNAVNLGMSSSGVGAIASACGGAFNKILIAIVMVYILIKRDEVKSRMFSKGLEKKEENNEE